MILLNILLFIKTIVLIVKRNQNFIIRNVHFDLVKCQVICKNKIPLSETGYNVLHFPRAGGDVDITWDLARYHPSVMYLSQSGVESISKDGDRLATLSSSKKFPSTHGSCAKNNW